jgi:glycosyltransferase involved in cell wall biosynthesis
MDKGAPRASKEIYMLPEISIVTPTHNRSDLLLRTLSSVRRQTFSNWEMLIVDDGDGSGLRAAAEVVHASGDARIRAFANRGNGQVDARNTALEHARGRIVHLLDDDDRWADPQHLERVSRHFRQNRNSLLHRGGWLVHEHCEDGAWIERERFAFDPHVSVASLRSDNPILCSGVAYPTALHARIGAFDAQMGHYWDWDWYLRVLATLPLYRISPPAVLISLRECNASHHPFEPDYVSFLDRLAAKHGLGALVPKNHLMFAIEMENAANIEQAVCES